MKYATRLNSFLKEHKHSCREAVKAISRIPGITHVDLNYPEHFSNVSPEEMKAILAETGLLVNSMALRFGDRFLAGEFANANEAIAGAAEGLCLEALKVCRALGGEVLTIWQAHDGFDYPFQSDYAAAWEKMKRAFRRIAECAAPDIRVSIEYKPFQPRSFSLLPNMASALLMAEETGQSNLGMTLDFCHMLMAGENPAASLDMAASHGRLFGIHLNDGYRLNDDGLMVASVHPLHTMEFLYYARKHNYDGVIYFDTFPVRERAAEETERNVRTTESLFSLIDELGIDQISEWVRGQDGAVSMDLLSRMLSCRE